MVWVLRRLHQLRHVDIVGPLGVAWVDVRARDAIGLLSSELLVFEARGENAKGRSREDEGVRAVGT